MARIIFKSCNIIHDVEDGSKLIDVCDTYNDVSLPFGCTEGSCGICELTVLSGRENCSKPNEHEVEYLLPEDIEAGMRLGCQLVVNSGEVIIRWKKVK